MVETIVNVEKKLNKGIVSFIRETQLHNFSEETADISTFSDFFANKMLIIAVIRAGIPYSLFEIIQEYTPFTFKHWADFLNISTKTLQRYKAESEFSFKPIHSEKIMELAEVTAIGLETFGSMTKLQLWLNTPNFALGNLKPLEMLKDSYGKDLVLSELIRINHGILV